MVDSDFQVALLLVIAFAFGLVARLFMLRSRSHFALIFAMWAGAATLPGCASGTQGAVALHFGRETARAICAAVGAVDAAFPEQPSGEIVVNVPPSAPSSSSSPRPPSSGSP